jgi:hypothetical protein
MKTLALSPLGASLAGNYFQSLLGEAHRAEMIDPVFDPADVRQAILDAKRCAPAAGAQVALEWLN